MWADGEARGDPPRRVSSALHEKGPAADECRERERLEFALQGFELGGSDRDRQLDLRVGPVAEVDARAAAVGARVLHQPGGRAQALEPEAYLRDVLRVLPHWPKDRHLELAPLNFAATRARLDAEELAAELGLLTVPTSL